MSAETQAHSNTAISNSSNLECNRLAELFEQGEDDSVLHCDGFSRMQGTPPELAQAIIQWLGSSYWYSWVDSLIERSFELEQWFSEFVDKLEGNSEKPRKRRRTKTFS